MPCSHDPSHWPVNKLTAMPRSARDKAHAFGSIRPDRLRSTPPFPTLLRTCPAKTSLPGQHQRRAEAAPCCAPRPATCAVSPRKPSSCDNCRMAMVLGGSIRFSTAALRSGEYPKSSSYPAHLRNRGKVEQRTTSLTQGVHRLYILTNLPPQGSIRVPGKSKTLMRA